MSEVSETPQVATQFSSAEAFRVSPTRSVEVNFGGSERHQFNFSELSYNDPDPSLLRGALTDSSNTNISGCMDREGRVFWTDDEKPFPPSQWSNLTDNPPVVIFEYSPIIGRLFVSSTDVAESKAVVGLFGRAGIDANTGLTERRLVNTAKIKQQYQPAFMGKISEWRPPNNDFVPDNDLDRSSGYREISPEDSQQEIGRIYEEARQAGKYIVMRTVGVPVEPQGLASASLLSPNQIEVFDARVDYDKGILVYEVSEDAVKASFDKDARTKIYDKKTAPNLEPGQVRIDMGDYFIYHSDLVAPVKIADLQSSAALPDASYGDRYSEVVFDPNNPDCELVAVINPHDVWGWSKIAYKRGVPEFLDIPELSPESKRSPLFPTLGKV